MMQVLKTLVQKPACVSLDPQKEGGGEGRPLWPRMPVEQLFHYVARGTPER